MCHDYKIKRYRIKPIFINQVRIGKSIQDINFEKLFGQNMLKEVGLSYPHNLWNFEACSFSNNNVILQFKAIEIDQSRYIIEADPFIELSIKGHKVCKKQYLGPKVLVLDPINKCSSISSARKGRIYRYT